MGTKNMLVANFLLSCAGSIQLAKLNQASRNPQAAAAKTLRNIITYAKDTAYGSITSLKSLKPRPTKNSTDAGSRMCPSTNMKTSVPMSKGTKTASPTYSSRANL